MDIEWKNYITDDSKIIDSWLDAVVFSSNAASIKMFKKAGFQLKERENGDSALDAVKIFKSINRKEAGIYA